MNLRYLSGLTLVMLAVLLAGCPKGSKDYSAGTKAESTKDYDSALENYNKALRAEPNNTEYKMKAARARFEAAQWHVDQGAPPATGIRATWNSRSPSSVKRRRLIPSSVVAEQEVQATMRLDQRPKQGKTDTAKSMPPPSSWSLEESKAHDGAAPTTAAFAGAHQHEGDQ